MRLPIYQVDAFTDVAFGGNPAAVMLLDAWLPDTVLQQIAMENNLSETAYLVPTPGGLADYHIRWFTPTVEIALCGHATLASAWVLRHHCSVTQNPLRFSTQTAGLIGVRDHEGQMQLDFPSDPPAPTALHVQIAKALGAMPDAMLVARNNYLAVFAQADIVEALQPDFARLKGLDGFGVIATAPAAAYDFVSRYFVPDHGIDEDPVTGSAHCALVPFWAGRLGKTSLLSRQVSARGGTLWCELVGERVRMSGTCVTVLEGHFLLSV